MRVSILISAILLSFGVYSADSGLVTVMSADASEISIQTEIVQLELNTSIEEEEADRPVHPVDITYMIDLPTQNTLSYPATFIPSRIKPPRGI